jgi:hypothetical protein
MNGKDGLTENLQRRAEGQMTGMRGMLEYVYTHKKQIKSLVAIEREKLNSGVSNEYVSIQSEHIRDGQKLHIPLFSYYSGADTVVTVNDYRPVVRSLSDVKKPAGYLIPVHLTELVDWTGRHSLKPAPFTKPGAYKIEQYFIKSIDSIDFEGDIVVNPQVVVRELQGAVSANDYFFVPTAQMKGNLLVLALEPKSMLGLITYRQYAHLLRNREPFPILRAIKK